MNRRTVEDILEDIDRIEENKGEMDSYNAHRLRILHEELHSALSRAGYQNKVWLLGEWYEYLYRKYDRIGVYLMRNRFDGWILEYIIFIKF